MIFHVSNYRGGGDDFVTFGRFLWWKCIKKTWFWTKIINISMHFGSKRIKGLCFSTFLCVNFDFFSWFFITKMYDHMLDHLHGQEWFFSQDFDVFWRENTLFLWGKVMFYVIFSEANVFFATKCIKGLCFSTFLVR